VTLRARLREVGASKFVTEMIDSKRYTTQKLLTAFGVFTLPIGLENDERVLCHILGIALYRELSRRVRLPQWTTIDHAAELLKQARQVMVITGAGVRCSMVRWDGLTVADFDQPGNPRLSIDRHGLLHQAAQHGICGSGVVVQPGRLRHGPSVRL
jgi:hypothetical protein